MTIKDIKLHTENATGFVDCGFQSTPAITEKPISLSTVELTRNGQPHLTVEKEGIGSQSNSTLTFSGIIFKGIPASPYNRVSDDGCFNTTALVGWIIGISVVLVVVLIAVFVILVQLHRSLLFVIVLRCRRNNNLYASYSGTGNVKRLQSSLSYTCL